MDAATRAYLLGGGTDTFPSIKIDSHGTVSESAALDPVNVEVIVANARVLLFSCRKVEMSTALQLSETHRR